jgi:gamma-glutamyl-gamma-aminobutyrate hydrolase
VANDGVIECIEDDRKDRWVVGVQWHPELNWISDPLSRRLFDEFIVACRKGRTQVMSS